MRTLWSRDYPNISLSMLPDITLEYVQNTSSTLYFNNELKKTAQTTTTNKAEHLHKQS